MGFPPSMSDHDFMLSRRETRYSDLSAAEVFTDQYGRIAWCEGGPIQVTMWFAGNAWASVGRVATNVRSCASFLEQNKERLNLSNAL